MKQRSNSIAIFVLAVILALGGSAFSRTNTHAAFPGSNGSIVFSSDRDGASDLYTMNPNGSGVARITSDSAYDLEPAWSPDGKRIAFTRTPQGNVANSSEIYLINSDGSGQTRLTNNSSEDGQPAWSPDGKRLAFRSNRDGVFSIYSMNSDGTTVTRLTSGPYEAAQPAWSPDGKKIAYASITPSNVEIFVMNSDGTNQANVSNRPMSHDDQPAWSPDGAKLAFRSIPVSGGQCSIFVMTSNGGSATNLNAPGCAAKPEWSPDGAKIVFSNGEIYAMNADGTGSVNLTNNGGFDESPSWQRISAAPPARPGITFVLHHLPRSLCNSQALPGFAPIYLGNGDCEITMPGRWP